MSGGIVIIVAAMGCIGAVQEHKCCLLLVSMSALCVGMLMIVLLHDCIQVNDICKDD